jgi:8-oxo-dGTP diphosphatase
MGKFDNWVDLYLGHIYPEDDVYVGPRGADVVVYSADTDDLLLLVRGKNPFRGFLTVPGGGVQDGESFLAAAVRELEEETALVVEPSALRAIRDYRYDDFDPRGCLWARRFLYVVSGHPAVTAGDDAADHRWISVDDLRSNVLAIDQAVGIRDALLLCGRLSREPAL